VSGFGPAGSWFVRGWITGPGGRELSAAAAGGVQNRMYAAMARTGKKVDPAAWLSAHHYGYWLSYQPAGRFWYFAGVHGRGPHLLGNRLHAGDHLARPSPRVAASKRFTIVNRRRVRPC